MRFPALREQCLESREALLAIFALKEVEAMVPGFMVQEVRERCWLMVGS